jgi:hypothetical protein
MSPLSPNLLVENCGSPAIPEPYVPPSFSTPEISFINAAAYACASKLPEAVAFQMTFTPEWLSAHSSQPTKLPNLSDIPSEYHEFADVFNKTKVDTLPPH